MGEKVKYERQNLPTECHNTKNRDFQLRRSSRNSSRKVPVTIPVFTRKVCVEYFYSRDGKTTDFSVKSDRWLGTRGWKKMLISLAEWPLDTQENLPTPYQSSFRYDSPKNLSLPLYTPLFLMFPGADEKACFICPQNHNPPPPPFPNLGDKGLGDNGPRSDVAYCSEALGRWMGTSCSALFFCSIFFRPTLVLPECPSCKEDP